MTVKADLFALLLDDAKHREEYADKLRGIQTASLISDWPLWEAGGSVADNYQGVAARDGTYSVTSLGNDGIGDGRTSPLFDGSNDYVDVYSASLNTAFNALEEGTITAWFRIPDAGVWADGIDRSVFEFRADANNYFMCRRYGADNGMDTEVKMGGTSQFHLSTVGPSTDWQHMAITYSAANSEVVHYLNGAVLATDGAPGTWSGNLATADVNIGALGNGTSRLWKGNIAHVAWWITPLTTPEVLLAATV